MPDATPAWEALQQATAAVELELEKFHGAGAVMHTDAEPAVVTLRLAEFDRALRRLVASGTGSLAQLAPLRARVARWQQALVVLREASKVSLRRGVRVTHARRCYLATARSRSGA